MEMIIRDGELSDLEQLTAIYNWAVENTTATFDLAKQSTASRLEWFNQHTGVHPLIVAELDGKAVGYCTLSKFREKEAYIKTVEISVYIHPSYQRRGIGTALVEEMIQRGKKLGHHVIIAGITAGNDISVKLHQKFGFELCGHMKEVGKKFGKWQDVLFYQLIIE
ncbi:MAG: N-acetyltransferase family protein [Clostridiales bacterium]|jgi:phosphinothricin acetyltransferase|nr:GNAT family N-acetyltransferase [Eubacteriales bacterium]MDH7567080.1 N-acetyltransferase family protein [Clostridiales bacterium]